MEILFAFVAYHNAKDANHHAARRFVRELEGQRVMFVTSDYIFDEVMTVLLVRGNKDIAIQAGKSMLNDPTIVVLQIDKGLFDEAWTIFHIFTDKEWRFTDCTSYALIKRLNIDTGISFDRDFKQFGVQAVPKQTV